MAFETELAGFDSAAVRHPLVRRAKLALKNREAPHRPKHFITFGLLTKLVGLALKEDDIVSAMIYVISYACLLRVPSECLPLVAGVRACTVQALNGSHSCCAVSETEGLVVTLARRKNRPAGSRLVRSCWCFREQSTCPVHAVSKWLKKVAPGSQPFRLVKPDKAITELRRRLQCLGVADAHEFMLQDFRRGHASDLVAAGAPLNTILKAGEWRSPAFLAYLEKHKVENEGIQEAHRIAAMAERIGLPSEAVVQDHLDESDSEF